MADNVERVVGLHEQLIELYAAHTDSEQAITEYIDTLKQYTSAVAVAASQAFAELLGIDADVSLLELTEEQRIKLEASDMLDTYIDGKDTTDD